MINDAEPKVCAVQKKDEVFKEKLENDLELLSAEACMKGIGREEFLKICDRMFSGMNPKAVEV